MAQITNPSPEGLTKPHFPILDGLRGTAALLVVGFHLMEGYFPDFSKHPMHHGYLAVDFFFLLSGFVIGYAYDDRWARMTVMDFFRIRLIRLHPLVIASMLIGGLAFYFDPFSTTSPTVSALKLLAIVFWGFTLLPHQDVRGWDETHSLNGPLWSLLQEYLANVVYALIGRRMNRTILIAFVIIWGVILTGVAVWRGDLAAGWGYNTFWIAIVRMMFPFFAGLLLYRTGFMIRIPAAYLICSLLLAGLFFFPTYPFDGWYEAACIIIAFPLIVAMGAGGSISGRWAQICNFAGIISYPIYIIHYPFMYIYMEWIHLNPDPGTIIIVGTALLFFFIGLAYVVLKRYDEPVRNWLKANWR